MEGPHERGEGRNPRLGWAGVRGRREKTTGECTGLHLAEFGLDGLSPSSPKALVTLSGGTARLEGRIFRKRVGLRRLTVDGGT